MSLDTANLNLIYDRTESDETASAAIRKSYQTLGNWSGLTDAERAQLERGTLTYNTLNRVEAAVKTLAAALTSAGYPVKVTPVLKGSSRVPAGYTEVEWIQSSGTQYIDTGILPGNTTQLAMDFEPTTLPASHVMAAGARNSSSGYTNQFVIGWAGHKSPAVWRSDFGDSQVSFPTSVSGAVRHQLDKDGATCEMDDTTVTNDESTFVCPYTLYLFAGNQNDAPVSQISMRLYTCRIYDNGTLVRNYIPCRNPDGEVGLYDLVGGEFYTNSGTGAFTAGPEIGKAEDREWQEGDVLYRPQWTTYLDNVQRLRDAYYTLADTGELPAPGDKLGYVGANAIEKVLADIDLLIDCMKSSYRRCGTFRAGNNAAHLPLKGT